MQLTGRPLLDNSVDAALFVERADLMARLEEGATRGYNTLLFGDRGMGKTTTLRQLEHRLRERDHPAVYVSPGPARNALDLLAIVRDELGQAPSLPDAWRQALAPAFQPPSVNRTSEAQLIAMARSLSGEHPATILLDELPDAETGRALFARLRDELWQLPYTWIVAADGRDEGALTAPPADAFFDQRLSLPALSFEEQQDLLRRRLGDQWDLDGLIALSADTPRRLLEMAREATLSQRPLDEVLDAQAERQRRVERLGRPASMVLHELEALERPVSASDDELLGRLGWTRTRALKVLNDLEQAGLVRSFSAKGERGAPRRMFVLTEESSHDER